MLRQTGQKIRTVVSFGPAFRKTVSENIPAIIGTDKFGSSFEVLVKGAGTSDYVFKASEDTYIMLQFKGDRPFVFSKIKRQISEVDINERRRGTRKISESERADRGVINMETASGF